MGKMKSSLLLVCFDPIPFILAGNEDMHSLGRVQILPDWTTDYRVSCLEHLKRSDRLIMEKWCLHASTFIFDRIIIKVAGNQDRHKSSDKFNFGLLFPWSIYIHVYIYMYIFFLNERMSSLALG